MLKDVPLHQIIKDSPVSVESSLKNINLIMQELRSMNIKEVNHLTAEKVYDNEDSMFELLSIIKTLFDGNKGNCEAKAEQEDEVAEQCERTGSEEESREESERMKWKEMDMRQVTIKNIKLTDSAQKETSIEHSRDTLRPKGSFTRSHSYKQRVQKQMHTFTKEEDIQIAMAQGIEQEHNGIFNYPLPTPPLSGTFTPTPKFIIKTIQKLPQPEPEVIQEVSEMSKASDIRKEPEIRISEVNTKTKQRVLNWLQDLRLIRQGVVSIEDFPGYCRNGVLFADLISKIEGSRNVMLSGIARNPRSSAAILANLRICFRYLQSKEKINSKYLWAEKLVFEGNKDVIWGILDDIWHFYNGKLSLNVMRDPLPCNFQSKDLAERSSMKGSRSFSEYKTQENAFTSRSSINRNHSKNQSNIWTNTQHSVETSTLHESIAKCTSEEEKLTRDWLKSLDLIVSPANEFSTLLLNPYRNGVLLCKLFEALETQKINAKTPTTVIQAQENIKQALNAFQFVNKLSAAEIIRGMLRGDKGVIWGIFNKIRELYTPSSEIDEYKNIEVSLITWLKSLGVIAECEKNKGVADIEEIRNGTALYKLIQLLLNKQPYGMLSNPRSEANCLVNIRSALDSLRNLPGIDNKQICNEREIVQGNRNAILLLLEELRNYHKRTSKKRSTRINRNSGMNPQNHLKESLLTNQRIHSTCTSESNMQSCIKQSKRKNYFTPSRQQDIFPSCDSTEFKAEYELTQKSLNTLDENLSCKTTHDSLLDWLKRMKVELPKNLILNKEALTEFGDGILLCKIIEALERRPMEGIIKGSKTSASSSHNIRKALELLHKKKVIPLEYLKAVDKIHKGDNNTIMNLLKRIKEGYEKKRISNRTSRMRKNLPETISSLENNAEAFNSSLSKIEGK